MKCQVCNAHTEVKETRDTNMRYRRRRMCTNGHYFTTEEVIVSPHQIEREQQERFEETRNKRLESIRASKSKTVRAVKQTLEETQSAKL